MPVSILQGPGANRTNLESHQSGGEGPALGRNPAGCSDAYELAILGCGDGLWDWDLNTNRMSFSPAWQEMIGCAHEKLEEIAQTWFSRVHPRDVSGLKAELQAHIDGHSERFSREYRIMHKNGEYVWMLARGCAARDSNGKACRLAGIQTEISRQKKLQLKLIHDVLHDSLTGLPNRTLLSERLRHALRRVKREAKSAVAVLYMDLDRFKVVNDSLGHAVGDQLLVEFSRRLTQCIRPGDTVARLGGDEFCVILEDVASLDAVNTVAARVREQFKTAVVIDGHELFITASIGIAMSKPGCSQGDLLRDADIAMYRAKSLGKSRQLSFQASMHSSIMSLQYMESGLHRAVRSIVPTISETGIRHALASNQFHLNYQPIVSLTSGGITGVEALLRWNHPSRGNVFPSDFIHIAEETELIHPITYWVIREAFRQLKAWNAQFPALAISMNVNLSGKMFTQTEMLKEVSDIVEAASVKPGDCRFEITEGVLVQNCESNATVLRQLKQLGVKLCMDDFGTGYSSLSYLHRFSLDVLKIDRSFISELASNDRRQIELVRGIINMAKSLSLSVVAEGVETAEQLARLRELGCDYAQGYFIAKPLGSAKMEELLKKDPRW